MTKGRDDVAEHMNDLFALMRTRHQSGLLSVERYENGRFEEGEIRFQKGQPIDAYTGNRRGQDAISWLSTWQQVYFLFSSEAPSQKGMSPRTPNTPPNPAVTGTIGPIYVQPPQPNSPQLPSSPQQSTNTYYERKPRKLVNEQNVMSLSLTRSQRSLYLLIDGHRTIADLLRFTNKDAQEVYYLLSELQEKGLVTL